MRKALLLVFVTTLLTLGLSANSVVYAQTDFTDCAACHGTTTDFTTPPVDKTSACIKCHWQPYHSLTPQGWPVETPPYGWFMSNPLLYSSTTIHAAHDGSNRYSQYPYDTYGCAVCHKTADCSSCHSSVSHQPHSASTYVSPTLTVCDGTSWYSTGVSCAKSLCHSQLPTIISQPVCTNCHPIGGHGDVTALHVSPQLTQDCISSNCHSSSSLNIEHENRGYDCFTCHNNPDPTRAATLRTAISSHNTNCSACHTAIHGMTGAHASSSCSSCHENNLKEEALCYACHNDIQQQFTVGMATWTRQKLSDYYHTVNTRHDVSASDQVWSGAKIECTNCHNPHLSTATNPYIDPDNRNTLWTQTRNDPRRGTVLDVIGFCLKCHDNTWAPGVTGPRSAIFNIKPTYISALNQGDQHGDAVGNRNTGYFNGYYQAYPRMLCTDCHDSHGGGGIYHLKTLTDQYGKLITITDPNAHNVAHWCSHCHKNPMNQIDSNKDGCLSRSCHLHGTSSF